MILRINGKKAEGVDKKDNKKMDYVEKSKGGDPVILSKVIEKDDEDYEGDLVKVEKEDIEEDVIEERFGDRGLKFGVVKDKKITLRVKHALSVKNDKVEMMLSSLIENYKEPIDMVGEWVISKEGFKIPSQDIFSFEMILERDKLDFYVTVKEESKDFMKQQLKFAWYRSPIVVMEKDIVEEFVGGGSVGYDLSLKHSSVLSMSVDDRKRDTGILRDLLESTNVLKKGEKVLIQCALKPAELSWWKDGEASLSNMSRRTKKIIGDDRKVKSKLAYPVFDSSMRMVVKGESIDRSELISRSFLLSFKQMEDQNEWGYKRIRDGKFEGWLDSKVKMRSIKSYIFFNKRDLLSPKELGMLVKLPNRVLQREFGLESDGREDLRIPKELRKKGVLDLGVSEMGGKEVSIGLDDGNLDDFMKSYCYIGSPRTGKDTSMINFIVEAAKKGHGAIIPDAINEAGNDRGMADSIRDSLPEDRIIDISMDDYSFPIYFGLDDIIEEIGENGINLMSDNLIKILKLDDKYESKKLARLVAKACRCNLYDMYCFVRSEEFQKEILERVSKYDELLALQIKNEYMDSKISNNVKGAILSRLDEMMGNDLLKFMFAQKPNKKITFREWISEGKVVIIRMTKTDIGELGTNVLMYLLTVRIFWLKKMMNKDEGNRNKTVFMVFNEFFQYMSESLEETLMQMIVEGPKYRLGMLFAFHAPTSNQISNNFWNTLRASSLNYFLFKNTNSRVYRDMEEQLAPIEVDVAMKTEKYESIFIPYVGGKQYEPIFVKMLKPPSLRQEMFDNSELTERHKVDYGTSIEKVKDRIREREMSLYRLEE